MEFWSKSFLCLNTLNGRLIACDYQQVRNFLPAVKPVLPQAVALFILLLHPATHATERAALILGNQAYPGNPNAPDATPGKLIRLDSVAEDVKLMTSALGNVGFTVESHQDLTAGQMKQALIAFQQKYNGTREVLFYFSGHGAQVAGENYLTGIDSDADLERETLELEAHYSGDELKQRLEAIESAAAERRCLPLRQVLANLHLMTPAGITAVERAKHVRIVILDACRSPFNSTALTKGVVFKKGGLAAADALKRAGVFIGFAAAANEVSLSIGAGSPSLFTQHFAERLQHQGDIGTVFKETRVVVNRKAQEQAGIRQFPAFYDEMEGSFEFVKDRPPTSHALPSVAASTSQPASQPGENASSHLKMPLNFGQGTPTGSTIVRPMQWPLPDSRTLLPGNSQKQSTSLSIDSSRDALSALRTPFPTATSSGLLGGTTILGRPRFVSSPQDNSSNASSTLKLPLNFGQDMPTGSTAAKPMPWTLLDSRTLLPRNSQKQSMGFSIESSRDALSALRTLFPAATSSGLLGGIAIPGRPGFVYSPYDYNQILDVRGQPSGAKMRCPSTGKSFVVP